MIRGQDDQGDPVDGPASNRASVAGVFMSNRIFKLQDAPMLIS